MKNYEMIPEDVQIFSDNLGREIEILEEEIEDNKNEQKRLLRNQTPSGVNMIESDTLAKTNEDMEKAVETLKQVKKVVDEVLLRVDEKVGFISDTHEFIYNEEECDKSIKAIDEKFSDAPLDGILNFSSEYEHFCGKMKRQEALDTVAIKDHKKKQEDNANFNINSGEMERLQESIVKANKELKDSWDEINMKYELVFGDLKEGKLIEEILREYDISYKIQLNALAVPTNENELFSTIEDFFSGLFSNSDFWMTLSLWFQKVEKLIFKIFSDISKILGAIAKAIEKVMLTEVFLMIGIKNHIEDYQNGKIDRYELNKQIVGEIGRAFGTEVGEIAGETAGLLIAIETFGMSVVVGKVAGGAIGGSIGENSAEKGFQMIFKEDNDFYYGDIHEKS